MARYIAESLQTNKELNVDSEDKGWGVRGRNLSENVICFLIY
jgi:hypothetical protein